MSQVNVIVIHVRAKHAAEYEKLFVERQLPRWRDYHRRGKVINAPVFPSPFGSDERKAVVKYIIVLRGPSMAGDHENYPDPAFPECGPPAHALPPPRPPRLR